MWEVFEDAVFDSLKVFAVLVPINFIISLIEPYLAGKINLKGKFAPLIGVSVGLFPQCGFSVVATDLYLKRHITAGTLLGVYLATSDEALPIFLANPDKALHILPLLAFKFVIGLITGYVADAVMFKERKEVSEHNENCNHKPIVHLGCCSHDIEEGHEIPSYGTGKKSINEKNNLIEIVKENENKNEEQEKRLLQNLDRYLVHPLVHSVKIFFYILLINFIFGIIIFYVGEANLTAFLSANKYAAPLFSVLVGIIPNCASSVVISNLYIMGGLGFGATLGGLLMNAGLGFAVLFKDKKNIKKSLIIFGVMFAVSLLSAYAVSFIFNFNILNI